MKSFKFFKCLLRVRDWFRLWRHQRHSGYMNPLERPGVTNAFSHDAFYLAKMVDMRMWTLFYAPNDANGLGRLQELHKLNGEVHYIQYKILWRRILPLTLGIVFATRFAFKHRLMNKGEDDVFETSFRDTYILNK